MKNCTVLVLRKIQPLSAQKKRQTIGFHFSVERDALPCEIHAIAFTIDVAETAEGYVEFLVKVKNFVSVPKFLWNYLHLLLKFHFFQELQKVN